MRQLNKIKPVLRMKKKKNRKNLIDLTPCLFKFYSIENVIFRMYILCGQIDNNLK